MYELFRRSCDPPLPPLNRKVRSRAMGVVKDSGRLLSILDVGGRKSPYTIGLPANITIIDLPREEVSRVLVPGGKFIMTTPNGDFVENRNPDHKRHYKKEQLKGLLSEHFENVEVEYAIAGGYFRKIGLRSWSLSRPHQTALSIVGNIVNSMQSKQTGISERAFGTHHLIATAQKPF